MKWIKKNVIPIALCVAGGYFLKLSNEYLSLPLNHLFQDCLILMFVIMGFWKRTSSVLILSLFTIFSLGFIEIYSSLEWNNLLRAILIIILLIYLFIWSKILNLKQEQL